MEIARRTYLFVAALFVFLVAGLPTEVEAQRGGLTCGWCWEMTLETDGLVNWFPRGGDECGWPNPGAGYVCARCGGTSHCHGYHSRHRFGPCHILCGGGGGPEDEIPRQMALSNAVSDLRSGLDDMDLVRVAETISSGHEGFSVEYLPEAGRIDLILACAPSIPAGTVPVPPEIRPALDQALKESVVVIAVSGRDAWRKQALEE